MSDRPFIEFLQVQQLAWQVGSSLGAVRPGVTTRVLSQDVGTGASSLLVRYPPGWRHDGDEAVLADEELFVLDGALRLGATEYGRYAYAHLPAGYHRSGMSTENGAVVLTFFSAVPTTRRTTSHLEHMQAARLIERVDAFDGDWGGNFHPQFPPGAGRKWLRRDPVTGDETWILGTMPLRSGRRAEKHPVVEEMYLLSGTLAGHVGTMRPGAYFWRPPEEWHGPFGSMTGNLMLFRTVGGPLSTEYKEVETSFSWAPVHRPILPDDVAGLPPFEGCGCGAY